MEPPVIVNNKGSYGSCPDCAGVIPDASCCVGRSNGMSVVPCEEPRTLLHLPELPMRKLLDLLDFRDILATAKTCRHLNQVISSEHLLARRWFDTLAAQQQNQFKEIARDISKPDLHNWLGQFTMDTTVADKLCSQDPADQTIDDDRNTCEAQKRRCFPPALFYTVGQLMVGCRQIEPVLEKRIINTPEVNNVSFNTHGDHLVIFRSNHTGTIFGFTGDCQWYKQAGFVFNYWVEPEPPFTTGMTSFIAHGRHVLTWDGYRTARIFAYNADHSCTEQFTIAHESRILSADLSCDGRQVVITCDDGSAKIHSWNDAGHWTLTADISNIEDIEDIADIEYLEDIDDSRGVKACFSPDGSRVLTRSVTPYTPNPYAKIHQRNEEGGWTSENISDPNAKFVRFSPNSNQLLLFGFKETAKILSLNNNLASATLVNPGYKIIRATASPDGRHVITINHQDAATNRTTLKIFGRAGSGNWTGKTGNIPIFNSDHSDLSPKFSPDSCHVMAAKDLKNLEFLSCDKHGNWVQNSISVWGTAKKAFFSPDSSHAAVITPGYSPICYIYGYDAARGWIEKKIIPHDHDLPKIEASFSADSRHIVTFCSFERSSGTEYHAYIHGRDGNGDWPLRVIATHYGPINTACFNDDGNHLVTASADGTAIILGRYANGSWVKKTTLKLAYPVRSAIFSADSRQVVTVSGERTVEIWRLVASGMGSGQSG